MNKELPVIWSPVAEQTYADIILFLISEWSLNSAKKFDKKTDKLIDTLRTQHKLCPESKIKNLRKCMISPQTSLIYRIHNDYLEIVAFIDNRSIHRF